MFKVLKKALSIEQTYQANSFIYILRKLPIFKDLFTEDIYNSVIIKKIIKVISTAFLIFRLIFFKFLYYFIIIYISYSLFPRNTTKAFLHIYFFLTIIGLFINNKLLATNKQKYFSIILFEMDATKYFRASLFYNTFINLILNTVSLLVISKLLTISSYKIIILLILTTFIRFIGEALNIIFYKRYKYIWYSNSRLYFTILISLLLCAALPYFNIYIPFKIITYITVLIIFLGVISLIYLIKVKDYKLIYKSLNRVINVMDSQNEKDYLKQAMIEVNKKDKIINPKKLKNKKGYDLFTTIFFERHKEILLRSAKKYSFIFIVIYLVLIVGSLLSIDLKLNINNFLTNRLSWFIIIMFFINRGTIITRAMFFNCDHALLRYNFYREEKTILNLFKKRLKTVININLLPTFIIGLGNVILLLMNRESVITIITTFFFIIVLSVFFSVHYLVIYYLIQPFNKNMEYQKASYSIIMMLTYFISYILTNLVVDSVIFSCLSLIITISYIVISLKLVHKYAPRTFKLN